MGSDQSVRDQGAKRAVCLLPDRYLVLLLLTCVLRFCRLSSRFGLLAGCQTHRTGVLFRTEYRYPLRTWGLPLRSATQPHHTTALLDLDLDIFAESARLVRPWHLRGRTVQLFCEMLLRFIILVSARFARCFLTFQLLPANFGFSADTILNFFAIFSSFLCSKLNSLPFAAKLPPVQYLRNGPASAFL